MHADGKRPSGGNTYPARGFRDVIVTLSDKNCTVVVADDNLEAQEVAQILSVVTNETSYTANDVIVCQY